MPESVIVCVNGDGTATRLELDSHTFAWQGCERLPVIGADTTNGVKLLAHRLENGFELLRPLSSDWMEEVTVEEVASWFAVPAELLADVPVIVGGK